MAAQEQPLGMIQLTPEQTTTPGLPASNGQHDADDGYSSSDMDISRPASPIQEIAIQAGSKRKVCDNEDDTDPMAQDVTDLTKKQKLSTQDERSPAECLPMELWQQAFLYLSPVMLSRCLRVSKAFNASLTTTKAPVVTPEVANGTVTRDMTVMIHPINSNDIWLVAKNAYFSGMPDPPKDWTVLRLLQLLGGTVCQFCARSPLPVHNYPLGNGGPGPAGVCIVWPLLIRTCGACWVQNTYTVSSAGQVRVARADGFIVARDS